jgi:hypothetical protein
MILCLYIVKDLFHVSLNDLRLVGKDRPQELLNDMAVDHSLLGKLIRINYR